MVDEESSEVKLNGKQRTKYLSVFKCSTLMTFSTCLTVRLIKKFLKYVKLYVYMKVYLTMNQMIGKELIITRIF
jgi:hypothetical protein